MPTYQGVTSYLPSIPYWSSRSTEPEKKPGEGSEDQVDKQREETTEGQIQEQPASNADAMDLHDAPNDKAVDASENNDQKEIQESADSATASSRNNDELTRDDDDLFGTLRRTGSIPGVTEDLIFQLAADVDATRAQDEASREEALGASMAEELPMNQAKAGAEDAIEQSEPASESDHKADTAEGIETETTSTQHDTSAKTSVAAPSEAGQQDSTADNVSDAGASESKYWWLGFPRYAASG